MVAGGGAPGFDTLFGGNGDDHVEEGSTGEARMFGGNGNDRLLASGGQDELYGEAGNDFLQAGSGDDDLRGGRGNDTLKGDAGTDDLWGGQGADIFVFEPFGDDDRIFDFQDRRDSIDLTGFAPFGVHDFGDLTLAASGGGTEIILPLNTALTIGVPVAALSGADFIFG